MRDTYLDYETRTIANLILRSEFYGTIDPSRQGWIISRINVPAQYRGQGHGSRMLKRILADADYFLQPLYLDILPSGPLDYAKLKDWYERHGFRERPSGEFKRLPRHDQPYADYRQVLSPNLARLFISEHAKEAIKQIARYNMPVPESDEGADITFCLHKNIQYAPLNTPATPGVDGTITPFWECKDCGMPFGPVPDKLWTGKSEPSPEYFKTSVQQAVEQLIAIAKDPDEDAPDRLAAIDMIFKHTIEEKEPTSDPSRVMHPAGMCGVKGCKIGVVHSHPTL